MSARSVLLGLGVYLTFMAHIAAQDSSSPAMNLSQNAEVYAVGWFTLSLINAGLAQSKGRSGLLWWLGSLMLGPVCTFLIVVNQPMKPKS